MKNFVIEDEESTGYEVALGAIASVTKNQPLTELIRKYSDDQLKRVAVKVAGDLKPGDYEQLSREAYFWNRLPNVFTDIEKEITKAIESEKTSKLKQASDEMIAKRRESRNAIDTL